MSKYKIGAYAAVVVLFSVFLTAFLAKGTVAEADNLVIVLDAGHDDSHVGASGNNLKEEQLNLQIALACKKELETYEGVTVYMIREAGPCPYGGQSMGTSVKCNLNRVTYAANVGADAYISLHNNSSTNTSARGVSVYYPTTNYKYNCGVTGAGLAKSVLNQLLTTGLQNRGISVRYSEDNSRYPDGSLADYYGVIKNSKLKGIPAIIIEHAFISNPSDASEYLSTQAKLERLGKLDAKGIAEYYGLKKKVVLNYSKASVSGSFQKNGTEYCLKAVNVIGADRVEFAVWSDDGGQDDICWYPAIEESSGTWKVTVPISKHASEGIYRVHTYVNQSILIDDSEFKVVGPGVQQVDISEKNELQGTFRVNLQGVYSGTDIDSVSAAVRNEASPGTVKWIPAKNLGNGSYSLVADIADFNYEYGTYQVHSYIRDKNGIVKCVDTRSVVLSCPKAQVSVRDSVAASVYRVHVSQVPYGTGMEEVRVRLVTSEGVTAEGITAEGVTARSNSKVAEYKAVKQQQGYWCASVYPAEIGNSGAYKAEVYGKLSTGKEIFLGEQSFDAVSCVQQLEGQINADSQTVFTGAGIEIISPKPETGAGISVQSWCDYAAVRKALEQSQDVYLDYVALELLKDTSDEMQLVFDVPDYMADKEIRVFQVVTGEALQLVSMDAFVSEANDKVTVQAVPDGLFVVAAVEERMLGDADVNHKIELRDAQLVLRAALGIDTLDVNVAKSCDVNGDGVIDLSDAQLILKRALGIIKEF